MASRGYRLVANALGRFGTPSARHYDLAARSIAARIGRKCPRWKHGPRPKIAMVERRKARVPPLRDAGAPRKRPGPPRDTRAFSASCVTHISAFTRVLCNISAFTRVLCHAAGQPGAAAPGRLSALRPPLIRVEKVARTRAPKRRGTEVC